MSEGSVSTDDAAVEQRWLDAVQGECNAVPRPPGDRVATQQELSAFWNALAALETYCKNAEPTAQQFIALGRPALEEKLKRVLADIEGARKAFNAPATPPLNPRPLSTKMLQLYAEQRAVEELELSAMQMVQTDPATAEPMLLEAERRAERNYADQEQTLQRIPDLVSQIPELRARALERKVQLIFSRGVAAALLGKHEDAGRLYDEACGYFPALDASARTNCGVPRSTLGMMLGRA
jgi:hypothetical protein